MLPGRPKRVRGERQRLQDAQWRQRQKQERQQLKETAQQLETQLEQLHREVPHLAVQTTSPSRKKRKQNLHECSWKEKAEAMKQGRIEAELFNMTLRRALAKEQKVAKSLHTIMNKRPVMPRSAMYDIRKANHYQREIKAQVSQCSHCCNPTTLHINPAAVRREIEVTLQRLYDHANATLNSTTADDSLSFNFDLRLDPAAGPTIEVTTTTPINCGMDHAVRLLGTTIHVKGPSDIAGPLCVPEPRRRGDDLHVQQFTVELGAPYRTVLLDGFGSTRKSTSSNWWLTLWAAISFDRCGALCFRECTRLAVHRSQSSPPNKCVIQSNYSITVEKAGGCTVVDGEPVDRVRDRALLSMGKQIKERYLVMQRRILVGAGSGDLVDFVGT